MKWNHHPTHGFRFSVVDALAIIVCIAFTIWGLKALGSTAWLFPFVLGHFFLFCNLFRVPRRPELVWAGCFIALAFTCLVLDRSILNAMWMVLPITAGVLLYAVRLPTYHGVGSTKHAPTLDSATPVDRISS